MKNNSTMDNSKEQPTGKCSHQTGAFQEVIEAYHNRTVKDGKLNLDSFNNDYGNVIYNTYTCSLCHKRWSWGWRGKPRTKWLKELFETAYEQ